MTIREIKSVFLTLNAPLTHACSFVYNTELSTYNTTKCIKRNKRNDIKHIITV